VIETPKAKQRMKRSYVYVFCGYFPGYKQPVKKIGISEDPIRRYKTIAHVCPYPIFLDYLFISPFSYGVEKHLHQSFKDSRVRNTYCKSGETEWFQGINDLDILTQFLNFDYNQKTKRIGNSRVVTVDYSWNFKPSLFNARGDNVDFTSLISNIEIDPLFDQLSWLTDIIKLLYPEQPQPE
jgi:hypothetical protein